MDQVVTAQELYRVAVIALTATTSSNLFQSVRLVKAEIWGAPDPVVGGETTCKIEWSANASGNLFAGTGSSVSDTIIGTGNMCHVSSRPPAKSLASFVFSGASAGNVDVLEFTIPERGIMDITLDCTINYTEPAIAGPALSGATPGTIYIRPIGGLTPVDPLNA